MYCQSLYVSFMLVVKNISLSKNSKLKGLTLLSSRMSDLAFLVSQLARTSEVTL